MVGFPPWVDVLAADELPEATLTPVDLDGEEVLLYRTTGQVFAVAGRCTHVGMPLRRGPVKGEGDGAVVTCPAHGSQFRLVDGRVVRPPAQTPLLAYDTREVDGRIELRPR